MVQSACGVHTGKSMIDICALKHKILILFNDCVVLGRAEIIEKGGLVATYKRDQYILAAYTYTCKHTPADNGGEPV